MALRDIIKEIQKLNKDVAVCPDFVASVKSRSAYWLRGIAKNKPTQKC